MLCHHAIGDAQSMNSFFDQILNHYSEGGKDTVERIELPKLPNSLSIGRLPSSAVKQSPEVAEWEIDKFKPLEQRSVGWLKFSLPEHDLEKLLNACRRETVWLTNLITVAILR